MRTTLAPLDPQNAVVALAEACAAVGLDSSDAVLIRLGENATFRLPNASAVARVARNATYAGKAKREVLVSRWLASMAIPAVRALNVPQPVLGAGRVVTFWETASDRVEYGTTAELAFLLRQLHALSVPSHLDMPETDPFERMRQRLANAHALRKEDLEYMHARGDALHAAYDGLIFALPHGVIHGDASVGNVFRDRNGEAILGDLDTVAMGPREWDLIQSAIYFDRFGWHTPEEYRRFTEIYGFDVMTWDGYPVLRDIRELLMVAWLAQNAADPAVAVEVEKRIRTLRTGESRKEWKPF